MSKAIEDTRKNQAPSKSPHCPYMHLGCLKYDPILKHGVCQTHANRHHKSVRCCWFPGEAPDGWWLAKLIGGYLRAPYVPRDKHLAKLSGARSHV